MNAWVSRMLCDWFEGKVKQINSYWWLQVMPGTVRRTTFLYICTHNHRCIQLWTVLPRTVLPSPLVSSDPTAVADDRSATFFIDLVLCLTHDFHSIAVSFVCGVHLLCNNQRYRKIDSQRYRIIGRQRPRIIGRQRYRTLWVSTSTASITFQSSEFCCFQSLHSFI